MVMKGNSKQNSSQDRAELRLTIVRMLFIMSLLFTQSGCSQAQSRIEDKVVYDVFGFYVPEGFKPTYDKATLALNSDPGVSLCSFVFMGTLPGDDDPEKNFEYAWNTLIVPALAGESTERMTWKDDRNNWKGFAGSTVASFDSPAVTVRSAYIYEGWKVCSAMFFFSRQM